jgi:hypothetical protein
MHDVRTFQPARTISATGKNGNRSLKNAEGITQGWVNAREKSHDHDAGV